MTTFGTSAYLKLLALNPKPRDTEIRKRLGTQKGGYDFHKAMRRIVTEYASATVDWNTTETRLKAISKLPERKSAISAAATLMSWINGRPIRLLKDLKQHAASPNGIYSVNFSPDFEIQLDGIATKIHLWNTIRPPIKLREAIGTLGLFVPDDAPKSIGILSLRTGELFIPSDVQSARDLARMLALDIERRFLRVTEEEHRERPKDRGMDKRTAQ